MGSSEERVGEGGGLLRRLCVFGVLELQGPRSMRKEPLLSMGREGIVGFGGWVHLEREQRSAHGQCGNLVRKTKVWPFQTSALRRC